MPEKTDNVAEFMRTYGIEQKNSVVWVFFAAHLLLLGLFLGGYLCKSPCVERLAMTVSTMVAITLVVLCTLVMIILVMIYMLIVAVVYIRPCCGVTWT
jgi:hypothetical protein